MTRRVVVTVVATWTVLTLIGWATYHRPNQHRRTTP